jgi:hypothetical protein
VIPGFNTDIEHNGTVYHVQTEDKGLPKRVIMSLVYDKGTILASKRESYADMDESIDTKALAYRVGRQHKLICAAVKAGRINELKAMSLKPAVSEAVSPQFATQGTRPQTAAPSSERVRTPAIQPRPEPTLPKGPLKITIVEHDPVFVVPTIVPTGPLELVIDAVRIIEDRPVLTADAVEIVSELSGHDRPTHQKLGLELLSDAKFKGGDRRTVNIMICRGTARRVVSDAQIMVKVLGSTFRPVIFHAKSDANGLARVHLQLPHFQAGRAALLVRAMSNGEEVELRRVVTPG